MLEFNTAEPPLKRYLLVLPWANGPGQTRVHLPYIVVACFTWAALVLRDTAAALFVDEWILRLLCVKQAWAHLLQLSMPLLEVTVGTSTTANILARFVAEHPHADFEIHDTDLQRAEAVQTPTVATDKPRKRSGHVRKPTFSSMTKLINTKCSMYIRIGNGAANYSNTGRRKHERKVPRLFAVYMYTYILSKLYSKMLTNIWQRHWSQINLHELLYDLQYKLTPTRAVMFKLPKTRWWGDHVQNTQSALIYDKWLHTAFVFDNRVSMLLLQP